MKKSIRVLFAFIALLGMMNCFVLEPALAVQEEVICLTPDGCDDCMVCCSVNHQIIPSLEIPPFPAHKISVFIEISSIVLFDSPSFSIFHPPALF